MKKMVVWYYMSRYDEWAYNHGGFFTIGQEHKFLPEDRPLHCYKGILASIDTFDALRYAKGTVMLQLEITVTTPDESGYAAVYNCKVLERLDAEVLLEKFLSWLTKAVWDVEIPAENPELIAVRERFSWWPWTGLPIHQVVVGYAFYKLTPLVPITDSRSYYNRLVQEFISAAKKEN